jgi:NADH-quinone oxidoreductase subunit G
MGTVLVNGKPVEIEASERLNVIQVADRAGVEVPRYCWHPALTVVASCRMCLVETGEKKPDGTIVMGPKLVPGCQTPVKDGTVVVTNSDKVRAAQAQTLEYLLLNHPLDCPVCDQAGECWLQDYSYRYGHAHSRLHEPKIRRPDKDYIGKEIVLFTDRCVMCSRCVRFTREISGTAELQVINRGSHAEIDIFPGEPCNNKLAGNVVDICPVGALCSKDFLYKQRVWWLKQAESVCPNCSTGCSITIDENNDHVYRLRPRDNPQAQGYFMCDEGRFGFKYAHHPDRLGEPVARPKAGSPSSDWPTVLNGIREAVQEAARSNAAGLVGLFSPWMTCEEAFLLAKHLKSLSPQVRLAMGPVPVEGEDDLYPKGVDGRPLENTQFTIRAEKCPNRAGVAAILQHFEGKVVGYEELKPEIAGGRVEALYAVGGYRQPWLTESDRSWLGALKLLIVQDILPSPASEVAHYVLPGGSFAEKDGTFVNHAGLAQEIHRAVRGPGESWPDGRILWELAGRRGLFHTPTVRTEIGTEIEALAALRPGRLGSLGRLLSEGPAAPSASAAAPGDGKPLPTWAPSPSFPPAPPASGPPPAPPPHASAAKKAAGAGAKP